MATNPPPGPNPQPSGPKAPPAYEKGQQVSSKAPHKSGGGQSGMKMHSMKQTGDGVMRGKC